MADDSKGRNYYMMNLESIKKISEEAYYLLCEIENNKVSDGTYVLENGVYVNVETYFTQPRKTRRFEVHRRYIDIHYMILGKEMIVVEDVLVLAEQNISEEYDNVRDIEFYIDNGVGKEYIIKSGDFLILYPEDGHMPCVETEKGELVQKAVVKIPVRKG